MARQEVVLKSFPVSDFDRMPGIQIPSNGIIYITLNPGDSFQKDFVGSLAGQYQALGFSCRTVEYHPDVDLEDSIPELDHAAGLVLVQPGMEDGDSEHARGFLNFSFCLVQKHAQYLMASAREKGGFLSSITFLGGGFGFDNAAFPCSAVYASLAGIVKTASHEWKDVVCRAFDLPFDPDSHSEDTGKFARNISCLSMIRGPVETGIARGQCWIPELASRPIPVNMDNVQLNLGSDDLVCITGGGRGVTAQCAITLARQTSAAMILLGRSRPPFDPPRWSCDTTDAPTLKKLILAHEFFDKKPSPAKLEKRYGELVANREILDTLDQIRGTGSKAAYISCDVTDAKAVAKVFARIKKEFGPVSAIIHGAGVIHDKEIRNKSMEQFSRVVSTKVDGLFSLIRAAEEFPLKYLVLFSSVAARTGNVGQCDYAAANEILNKVAWDYGRKHPDCATLAVNWGPWDGGMVTDSLRKVFEKRGIDLIPIQEGAKQLVREMVYARTCQQREVVIGAHLTKMDGPEKQKYSPESSPMNLVMSQPCSLSHIPILRSHIIDHVPVLPFALILEWFAHAAQKNNPGLVCSHVSNVRLFKGVRLSGKSLSGKDSSDRKMNLEVYLSSCVLRNAELICRAELRSMDKQGRAIVHAGGDCILVETLSASCDLPDGDISLEPSDMTASRAYESILFHGKGLQYITNIFGISSEGIEVEIFQQGLSDSEKWGLSSHEWKMNPLMLDAAFQAVILWCHHHTFQVCLPGFVGELKRCSDTFNEGTVRILFKVTEHSRFQICGDFYFFDEKRQVLATIKGFQAIVDPGLKDKCRPLALRNRHQILEFAQGKPSLAFGDKYEIFDDQRQIARLPRPPYFFMDEVVFADHSQWVMEPGGWVRSRYQIPENAWYFAANHGKTMPFCILLEIALQPCGWLAAWAGSALHSEERLYFRNLGGRAKIFAPVPKDTGTLTVACRMTEVSRAGGMIIQNFDFEVASDTELLYQGTTNFGFFTENALSRQVGIKDSTYCTGIPQTPETSFAKFGTTDAPLDPHDPDIGKNTGMPAKALRMIDAIDILDVEGGLYENGYIQAHKVIDPDEWFFHAHFYQDPVCPGSLGVESFLQMLRFFLLEKYGINPEKYQVMMTCGQEHEWIYRGQIIPANNKAVIHAHVSSCQQTDTGYRISASGALVVDGITIYEMKDFSLEFTDSEF